MPGRNKEDVRSAAKAGGQGVRLQYLSSSGQKDEENYLASAKVLQCQYYKRIRGNHRFCLWDPNWGIDPLPAGRYLLYDVMTILYISALLQMR